MRLGLLLVSVALLSFPVRETVAAAQPKATQEMLRQLKLDPSILANLDQELRVPAQWLAGARKEGMVWMRGTPATPKELANLFAPFRERYPFINVDYFGSNQEERTIKTLVSYRAGKVSADLVESIGGFLEEYRKAGALEDMRDIPNWNNLPPEGKAADGLWVGRYVLYWCMSYNTQRVKKTDLPRIWDDLLTNPKWKGGNLALGNRPQLLWVNVAKAKGPDWMKTFFGRLFAEVKPQLRKEGMNALPQLLAAGEFQAVIPTSYRRAYEMVLEGAPVGFTCPEPVPGSFSDMVMMRRAPHPYAAKLLMNWLLSKEGQIAYYHASYYAPIHKELQRREFIPFAEEIVGKKVSFWYKGEGEGERELEARLFDLWNPLWLGGSKKVR